jgi:hypothetical protein
MRRLLFAAAAAAISMSGTAIADTTLDLSTGYNYQTFSLYPLPTPSAPNVPDNYWIKIASYEPPATTTSVIPAFVLPSSPTSWPPPSGSMTNSRWLGPRPTAPSSSGTSVANPAYSIFRKCFCLMSGYQKPRISLDVRADDNVQVWLNTMTATLVGPAVGNWSSGAPLHGATEDPAKFKMGRNCVYVLVEDYRNGYFGFDLAGSVSALGLMPVAGAGVEVNFAPCQCSEPHGGPGGAKAMSTDDDSAIVQAIVKIAEARRLDPKLRAAGPPKPGN